MPTEILLVDDHSIVRQGLRILLEEESEYRVVGEACNGHEAIQLARQLHPQVAVLDLAMPLLNGLDAARGIQRASPKTRTILLTVHREDAYVLEALQAGIQGYLVKTRAASDLVQAIQEVLAGRIYLSPCISRTVVEAYLARTAPPRDVLSLRERQVLQLIAEGKSSKEIAGLLGFSVRTAESHRARIMKKLDIHDTPGLVRYAVRRGIVQP